MQPTTILSNSTEQTIKTQAVGDIIGTNFPMDGEGRVYHLGLKAGEIANRILLVGDPDRAEIILQCLDNPQKCFKYASNRGFTTYTGTRDNVPVTIMSIGMGFPMMDFAIREIRAITKGPLNIIRLGSCGTPRTDISISTVVVAKKSYGIFTNYTAYYNPQHKGSYFTIVKPLNPDPTLHAILVKSLSQQALSQQAINTFPVIEATDATADSFYSSQGRIDDQFDDQNKDLIDEILEKHPETGSLQMETYQMFHLAELNRRAQQQQMIHVAACAIVLAQRKSNEFLSHDRKHKIELIAGKACLDALIQRKIEMM